MKLSKVRDGQRFSIWALDVSDDPLTSNVPTRDFIQGLQTDQPASFRSLANTLARHADHGPLLNQQKSRELEDGIFEFKSPQGARLLWFYAPGSRTILTHGFHKGAKLNLEIERAKRLRAEWQEAQNDVR